MEEFIIPSGNHELIRIATGRVLREYDIENICISHIGVPHHYARSRVAVFFASQECWTAYKLTHSSDTITTAILTTMALLVSRKWDLNPPR